MKNHLIYLREGTHPIGCVAVREDGDNSAYQLSTTAAEDHFDKPLARTIASGRLKKRPIPIAMPVDGTFHQRMRVVVQAIIDNKETPKRARNAAKAYLNAQEKNQKELVEEAIAA